MRRVATSSDGLRIAPTHAAIASLGFLLAGGLVGSRAPELLHTERPQKPATVAGVAGSSGIQIGPQPRSNPSLQAAGINRSNSFSPAATRAPFTLVIEATPASEDPQLDGNASSTDYTLPPTEMPIVAGPISHGPSCAAKMQRYAPAEDITIAPASSTPHRVMQFTPVPKVDEDCSPAPPN